MLRGRLRTTLADDFGDGYSMPVAWNHAYKRSYGLNWPQSSFRVPRAVRTQRTSHSSRQSSTPGRTQSLMRGWVDTIIACRCVGRRGTLTHALGGARIRTRPQAIHKQCTLIHLPSQARWSRGHGRRSTVYSPADGALPQPSARTRRSGVTSARERQPQSASVVSRSVSRLRTTSWTPASPPSARP